MNPLKLDEHNFEADITLESLESKGVKLWARDGQLHYKTRKGGLTADEIRALKALKAQILAALVARTQDTQVQGTRIPPRPEYERAPFSFSQLWHWHSFRLDRQPRLRVLAYATHLLGPLDVDSLKESFAVVVRRHDALRTGIVIVDGVPTQQISSPTFSRFELEIEELGGIPERAVEAEIQGRIDRLILEPLHSPAAPLFAAQLLKLEVDQYVLIVAMDHLISDAYSLNLLLGETFLAYTQLVQGKDVRLPELPVQYPDYAYWQRNQQALWVETHGAYWSRRLANGSRRFPSGDASVIGNELGLSIVPIRIPRDLKAGLREWCRLRGTTLAMCVFSVYAGLLLRWFNDKESIVQYQTSGRVNESVENTIGYFASLLCMRIELRDDDRFDELVQRVTEEYCRAYEHADFSYMATQLARSDEVAPNSIFNWVPQEPKVDVAVLAGSEHALTSRSIDFLHPAIGHLSWDSDPEIVLYDTEDEIAGHVYFPANKFGTEEMERFGRNFLMFVKTLLWQPEGRISEIVLL